MQGDGRAFVCMYKCWWCIICFEETEKERKKNSHHADLNDRIRAHTHKIHKNILADRWLWSAVCVINIYKLTTFHVAHILYIFVLKIEWFIAVSLMENVLNLYRSLKIRQRQQSLSFIKICSDREHWCTEGSCCCACLFY